MEMIYGMNEGRSMINLIKVYLLAIICVITLQHPVCAVNRPSSPSQNSIDINFKAQRNNNLIWTIEIDSQKLKVKDNQLQLILKGRHRLDEEYLKTVLSKYNIQVSKASTNQAFMLTLPDDLPHTEFDIITIDNEKQADNKMMVSGVVNEQSVSSEAEQHYYDAIISNVKFDEQSTEIRPSIEIKLINKETFEIVAEKIIDHTQQLQFSDQRVYNDNDKKIDYAIKVTAPDDYEVVQDHFDVSIKKKEIKPEIQDKVQSTAKQDKQAQQKHVKVHNEKQSKLQKERYIDLKEPEKLTIKNQKVLQVEKTPKLTEQVPIAEKHLLQKTNPQLAASRSIMFSALTAVPTNKSSQYRNVTEAEHVFSIGWFGNGRAKFTGELSPDSKSIIWTVKITYLATLSREVEFGHLFVTNGIKLSSETPSAINLGTLSNGQTKTFKITTSIDIPNLDEYTLAGQLRIINLVSSDTEISLNHTIRRISDKPILNPVSNLDEEMTGTAKPGEKIVIKNSSGTQIGSGIAGTDGKFTIKMLRQKVGTVLSATSQGENTFESDSMTITVTGVYTFNMQKVNNKNEILQGAVFKLSGNGITLNGTSNTFGKISFMSLKPGRYTLTETSPPNGYNRDNVVHEITIDNAGKITVDGVELNGDYKNISTPILRNIQLSVYDATNNQLLSGATYQLYDRSNGFLQTVTSDNTGKVVFTNLPYGTYSIIQTKAPTGYKLNATKQNVTINNGDVSVISSQYKVILPETGGMGTFIFFLIGSMLISISFIIKKFNH